MPNLNIIASYQSVPVEVKVKKYTREAVIDRDRMITSFQVQRAINEVNRAINAWYYQE